LRSFLESLHFLATDLKTDVRFCCVSPDFRLVLDATPLRFRPSFVTESQGVSSYEYEALPNGDQYISLTDQGEDDFSVEG
jgi:hypothetical protein